MIRVSSSLYRGAILTAMLALAFAAGCKKKPPAAPPPPPPPPPAAARPTVSLQANPTSVNKGDSTTLSWTSTDATQLTISPDVGAVTAQGSSKITPSDSTTYTITASGPGGSADSSARVTVSAPPPPPPPQPTGPRALLQCQGSGGRLRAVRALRQTSDRDRATPYPSLGEPERA